jgi:hypothetical protein
LTTYGKTLETTQFPKSLQYMVNHVLSRPTICFKVNHMVQGQKLSQAALSYSRQTNVLIHSASKT